MVAKNWWSTLQNLKTNAVNVVKRYFDELFSDQHLTCPESLFHVIIFIERWIY